MKILKTASGSKLNLSKKEWETIGKKAGWDDYLSDETQDHKEQRIPGFTKRYHVNKLVYFEMYERIDDAIDREKQIKAGSRQKKEDLIDDFNPTWRDLSDEIWQL